MGFVETQAVITGYQTLMGIISHFVGIFLGSTYKYDAWNRGLVLVTTVLYWSGPVQVLATTTRLGYDRELSDELGLRFLEEAALWGIFSYVIVHPVSQFVKVWFMSWRFLWYSCYDKQGCTKRRTEHVWRQAIVSVADGTGGLFGSDWLYNWRDALEKIGEREDAWKNGTAHDESDFFGDMRLKFLE